MKNLFASFASFAVLGSALFASPSHAAEKPNTDPVLQAIERFSGSIRQVVLSNGLRVVMAPDPTVATVAVSVSYDVGSSVERTGETGFAHLFEHMMFEGSRNVKKGQLDELVSGRGGSLDGTTNADRTNYFEVLPASELELALFIEADRMRALNVTRENFENQRAVVQEEYRMRIEDVPYVPGMAKLNELVFADYSPYRHWPIGSLEDLEHAKFEWVKSFYDRHYGPDTAVLGIAGAFDPAVVVPLVEKHFARLEPRKRGPVALPPMPSQIKGQNVRVIDTHAHTPALLWGWLIPPSRTPDHYALEVLSTILGDGESSRLYRRLVHDLEITQVAAAGVGDQKGPDIFMLSCELTEKGKLEQVRTELSRELTKLSKTLVSKAELQRAQRRIRSQFVFGLEHSLERATTLSDMAVHYGDARLIAEELPRYFAVTEQDIKRVAETYLTEARRSSVEVIPSEQQRPQ